MDQDEHDYTEPDMVVELVEDEALPVLDINGAC